MQQYKAILLVAILPLMTFLGNAQKTHTPDPEQAKRELLGLEQKWLQGETDPSLQEKILADDFVHVLPSGFISKKDQIDFLRGRKQPADQLNRHFEDLKIRVYGEAAIVNGMVVATDNSGKPVRKTAFTDVFAYRNGRWQAVNAQENDSQAAMLQQSPVSFEGGTFVHTIFARSLQHPRIASIETKPAAPGSRVSWAGLKLLQTDTTWKDLSPAQFTIPKR